MKRLKFLYLAAFAMQLAGAVGVTGLPLMAKLSFGTSFWGLALVGMTGPLVYTIMCLVLKSKRGRVKPAALTLSGILVYFVTFIVTLAASRTFHLVLAAAGAGVGAALFWPMLEAFIARGAAGRRISRRMGLFNISWSLGDAVGTAIGGIAFDIYPTLPFLLVALLMVPLLSFVLIALRQPEEVSQGRPIHDLDRPADKDTNSRFRKGAWVGNFVGAGVTNILKSVFAAPAADVFRMGGLGYGFVIATFNAARTLTFLAMRLWHGWRYRRGVFLWVNSLLALGMITVVAASYAPLTVALPVIFVAFAAAGVGVGMTYFSSIFYTVDTDDHAESTTPIHEAVLGAGGGLAAVAAGLTHQFAPNALSPLAMCAVVVAMGMVVSARCMSPRNDESNTLAVSPDSQYPRHHDSN